MPEHKFKAVRGCKVPRKMAARSSIIAPNHLQRHFIVDVPDEIWVTDITLYLGVRQLAIVTREGSTDIT